jgi:hypothetical protein
MRSGNYNAGALIFQLAVLVEGNCYPRVRSFLYPPEKPPRLYIIRRRRRQTSRAYLCIARWNHTKRQTGEARAVLIATKTQNGKRIRSLSAPGMSCTLGIAGCFAAGCCICSTPSTRTGSHTTEIFCGNVRDRVLSTGRHVRSVTLNYARLTTRRRRHARASEIRIFLIGRALGRPI